MRPNRLGIHTAYTPTNRRGTAKIHHMLRFEAITMILSCLYWKKFQGPIKLYCDQDFYDYIKKLGITDLWDDIDTKTIIEGFSPNVNHDTFWAYAKMYVNSLQDKPFTSIDLDLFQSNPYDYSTHDIICSHIEYSDFINDNVQNRSKPVYYPNYHEWDMFKERFLKYPNLKFTDHSLNVAVLSVNKPEFCKEVFEIAKSFAENNKFDPQKISTHGFERIAYTIHSSSLITFIEQRIASAVANTNNYSLKTMMGLEYDAGKQGWIGDVSTMYNPGITHLWGWKATMRFPQNEQERIKLTKEFDNQFHTVFPNEYDKYMPNIWKFCNE